MLADSQSESSHRAEPYPRSAVKVRTCLPCPAANWLSMRIFHIENNFDPAAHEASQLFGQGLTVLFCRSPVPLINHWPPVAVPCVWAKVSVRPWRVRANVIPILLITKFHKAGSRPFGSQLQHQVAERTAAKVGNGFRSSFDSFSRLQAS